MNEQYTVRIYDIRLVDKLEQLYKKCKDIYSNKNPFLVDCVLRGVEAIENDLFGTGEKTDSIGALYNEVKLTVKKLDTLLKLCEKSAKETMANLSINQKLLSCNYNMLLGLSEDNPKPTKEVESGSLDDLPERLEDILTEVLEHFLGK